MENNQHTTNIENFVSLVMLVALMCSITKTLLSICDLLPKSNKCF